MHALLVALAGYGLVAVVTLAAVAWHFWETRDGSRSDRR